MDPENRVRLGRSLGRELRLIMIEDAKVLEGSGRNRREVNRALWGEIEASLRHRGRR